MLTPSGWLLLVGSALLVAAGRIFGSAELLAVGIAGLAVAMITTLYGVILSRLVFAPAASKLTQREEIARFRNYLIAEGLAMLADKASPRHIQDRMNSYLDPTIRYDIDKQLRDMPDKSAKSAPAAA